MVNRVHITTNAMLTIIALTVLRSASVFSGEYNEVLSFGDVAPAWNALERADDNSRIRSDLVGARFVVLAFGRATCPFTSGDYFDKLVRLQDDYRALGVQVAFIFGGYDRESDQMPEVKKLVSEHQANFPCFFDPQNGLACNYGVSYTMTCFILDEHRRVVYMGLFDADQLPGGPAKSPRSYLQDALNASLLGKTPTYIETQMKGCHLGVTLAQARLAKKATDSVNTELSARTEDSSESLLPQSSTGNAGREIRNTIDMRLTLIPAGEFFMGSGAAEDEQLHRVRISHAFYMGVHEVTQAEYQRVMGLNPAVFASNASGRNPVENVSWEDAQAFCQRLSVLEGREYRLPTEAEWEYACRSGTHTAFHSGGGERALAQVTWLGEKRTHQVGEKLPNAFGLYDMHGNASEWCQDWYGADYYRVSRSIDPRGPITGTHRIVRGGDWSSSRVDLRSAYRSCWLSSAHTEYVGFRVVLALSQEG